MLQQPFTRIFIIDSLLLAFTVQIYSTWVDNQYLWTALCIRNQFTQVFFALWILFFLILRFSFTFIYSWCFPKELFSQLLLNCRFCDNLKTLQTNFHRKVYDKCSLWIYLWTLKIQNKTETLVLLFFDPFRSVSLARLALQQSRCAFDVSMLKLPMFVASVSVPTCYTETLKKQKRRKLQQWTIGEHVLKLWPLSRNDLDMDYWELSLLISSRRVLSSLLMKLEFVNECGWTLPRKLVL